MHNIIIVTKLGVPVWLSLNWVIDYWNIIKNDQEWNLNFGLFYWYALVSKDFDLNAISLQEYLKQNNYITYVWSELNLWFIIL